MYKSYILLYTSSCSENVLSSVQMTRDIDGYNAVDTSMSFVLGQLENSESLGKILLFNARGLQQQKQQ